MALESEISKLALGDNDGKAQQQPIAEPGTELSVAADSEEKKEETKKEEEEELVDPAGLSSSFDKLLFEYCELVDTYQSLRLRLSHLFAEGFLNLAQANYGRSRGHFGRDQYHGNMHASRILELTDKTFAPLYVGSSETNDLSYVGMSMTDAVVPAEDMAELEKKEKEKRAKLEAAAAAAAAAAGAESAPAEEKIEDVKEQVGASGADASATTRRRKGAIDQSPSSPKDGEDEKKESVEKETVAKPTKPKLPLRMDAIRWFGVLVPQQLRLSQRCFGEATETVAELVSVCNRMDALEGYIRQVRKS